MHRFVAEGGKSRKAAEQADEKKGAGFSGDSASKVCQFSQKSDDHTTHDIDRQGAERKLDALAQFLDIPAHSIAKDRANETTCADKQKGAQIQPIVEVDD